MKVFVALMLVALSFPAGAQTKAAKKKAPSPTPTAVPSPTPSVQPICRTENKPVRRAAIEMKLVLNELPSFDSRGVDRWTSALDGARERLKGEASMADVDAAGVKESLGQFEKAFSDLRFKLGLASIDMVVRKFMRTSDINDVADGRVTAFDEISAVLKTCD